jgi:transposase InsO family protein
MTLFSCVVAGILGKRRVGRVFLEAEIGKTKTKVLYDTGADISCLDEKEFRKIPVDQRPKANPFSTDKQYLSASKDPLTIKGVFDLPITIYGKTIIHPFYVIKNLSDPVILGADFIHEHKLSYCPEKRDFFWSAKKWSNGVAALTSTCVLPAFSVSSVKVNLHSDQGNRPDQPTPVLVHIQSDEIPLLAGGPGLITPDSQGQAVVEIRNCGPDYYELKRGQIIGILENAEDYEMDTMDPKRINAIINKDKKVPMTPEMNKFIEENAKINVPNNYTEKYMQLLKKHHAVFSRDKTDLGRSDLIQHEIHLKSDDPIYVKQFKMPDVHRDYLEEQVKEWLKLGIVQPTRSRYNSPMFLVNKKDGGFRVVQDFRALNSNSHIDKYTMKDVSECIGEIGRSNSTIFSTLDLTSGFWQMLLHPKSRPYTAFTIPGMGQFQWVTSAMGLLGCPSTFQRLVEAVVEGLVNIIVYIDDLIVHSDSHEQHLQSLDQLFDRLHAHNLKVNLKKCVFGSKDVMYLGFHLTEAGIKPGIDKLKAVKETLPPKNVHEIRQFLGLCNFFRTHVRNFAQISSPLTALTKKDSPWKSGPLPDAALSAFRELQSILCSEPVVDYPRRDRPYSLITDAALGDDKNEGGLGAILTQQNEKGEHCVIAYASRKLQKHEKNYTPFLLEMQAAIWAMDHFSTYLIGRHFTLYTDHKPLEKLGKVHTRTFNRLQEMMNTFDFEIMYKKGAEMPADFLSRNVVASINLNNEELAQKQQEDEFLAKLRNFLLHKVLPSDEHTARLIFHLSNDVFIENNVMWRRLKVREEPGRVVILLPRALVDDVLQDAHGHLLTGHDGEGKTKDRLLQSYWWPKMDKDIIDHLRKCHRCQARRVDHKAPPQLLSPLPQCTEPNQRIHCDLFGPLKISGNAKKYILCMTDAFTKYVELVALPDKEALTVTSAVFNRWICRYGLPLEIVTDQGREFCNKMSDELYRLLGTRHQTTTARHPQCNAAAEVCNKTIAKYLNSFVDASTLDWELYLAPLMFCYNTSFHRSVKNSPYFLTYGIEPRLPSFPTPDLRRTFYGESEAAEMHQRLLLARKLAIENNFSATEKTKEYFDKINKAKSHSFVPNQLILLEEYNFLGRNTKLCPKWSGPHTIINLKGTHCVELLLNNNRKTIVNVDRIKPYFFRDDNSQGLSTNLKNEQSLNPSPDHFSSSSQTDQLISEVDDPSLQTSPALAPQTSRLPLSTRTHSPTLPKKRGRPPKTSAAPAPALAASPSPSLLARDTHFQNKGGIVTRSQTRCANQNKQVSSIEEELNNFKKSIKKWYDLENVCLRKTRIRLCHCPSKDHTPACQQKWTKVMDLVKLYKTKHPSQFHSVSSEPAELEEEVEVFNDIDDDDDLDPGYGGSSPIPEPLPDDDEIVEEDPAPEPPKQEAERLSPVPGTSTDRHLQPHLDVTSPRPTALHPRPSRSTTSPDSSSEFHSINSTLQELERTLEQLTNDTSIALANAESDAEHQQIIDNHYGRVLELQQAFEEVQSRTNTPPSERPSTSTPTRGRNPFSKLEEILFGETTPVRRHTRRQGDVEDLPLPRRPPEYKPIKKK